MQNEKQLKDRVAIITGGSKGIGRSIAMAYAEQGANLVICGRNESLLDEVSREAGALGVSVLPVRTDVSVEADVENMVERALKEFGQIDILVNNAGIPGPTVLITEIKKADWDAVVGTNVTGVFLCSRAVLRHMIGQGKGNIVNISSGAGKMVKVVRSLSYNVSKFAVEGLTAATALQMKPYGICVNALRPGMIDTDFHKDTPEEWRAKMPPMRQPDVVKEMAVFLALQTVDTMTGESVDLAEWEKSRQS
ncbi:SDR family NAD(P)-dependent oxidoreductase [Chloroflexota bacterium]